MMGHVPTFPIILSIIIQFVPFMLRLSRILKHTIVNPKILHDKVEIRQDNSLPFYPLVGFKETKLGAMTLNKPDNNNNITEQCSDELFRFLNSYHHDHSIENVWIENRGKTFSGGADLEELKNNELYLDKLHRLSIMLARFNKPIFAKVNGSVRGIAAYVLTMFSTPIGTENSDLRIDETARGFIPIFGGTHRLSRLPCNVGLYLALTGQKIDAEDMARLGFLRATVSDEYTNKELRKNLSDANLFMRYNYSANSRSLSELRRQSLILQKMRRFDYFIGEAQKDLFNSKRNFHAKFSLNQYNLARVDYENIRNPYNSLSPKNVQINNYFQMRHDRPFNFLKKKQMIEEALTDEQFLATAPTDKLVRIFGRNSLQEILEELKADGSAWAKRTEEQIRKKDPLAQHLTFALIKQARESSWVQCLERQYTVAKRLLNDGQISLVEHEKGSLKVLTNSHSKKNIEDIIEQDLKPYLSKQATPEETFEHDSPEYALYPTSDYWRKFPDSARNYLNRTLFDDKHLQNHREEVIRFLQTNNIDYRDRSYNIPALTRSLYRQDMYEKLYNSQVLRLRGILKNPIELKKLQSERNELLSEMLKNEDTFANLIKEEIRKYFSKRFQERYGDLIETAQIAGKESKMDIFRSYVDTMTKNIVLNGHEYQQRKKDSYLAHGGIVRFDKEGKNVFEAESSWQKNNPALTELKQIVKDGRSVSELSEESQQRSRDEQLLFKDQKRQYEKEHEKMHKVLMKSYGINKIEVRNKAEAYRAMIERAALTSKEMEELLGWENTDIEAMIDNAPKPTEKFIDFAEKFITDDSAFVEERIAELNAAFSRMEQLKLMDKIKEDGKIYDNEHSEIPMFFDLQMIPRPFRKIHFQLLNDVLKFFTEKYDNSGSSGADGSSKLLNQWVQKSKKANFTEFLKYDVQYVYSYIAALHVKEMLDYTKKHTVDSLQVFKDKFNVNFAGYSDSQINGEIIKLFYTLVDMHGEAKHRILMPQSKLLDFISRQRVHKEVEGRGILSYESLVTMIAKDRKRLRDYINGKTSLLGYEPEQMLDLLVSQKENYKENMPKPEQDIVTKEGDLGVDTAFNYFNRINAEVPRQTKRLVVGFNGYLMRFQTQIQKIAGSQMFLPEQLRRETNKKAYEQVKNLLKTNLSHQQWLQQKLQQVVKILLEFRLTKQQTMTKGELALFDEEYITLFQPATICTLINFEGYKQQQVARELSGQDHSADVEKNDFINYYYEIKREIKNPKALNMLNNLILSRNVLKDRYYELDEEQEKRKPDQIATYEELNDMSTQMDVQLPRRTFGRLFGDIMRYKDDETPYTHKNKAYINKVLGSKGIDVADELMSEVSLITDKLQKSDPMRQEIKKKMKLFDLI